MKKKSILLIVLALLLVLLTGCATQTETEKAYLAAQELLMQAQYPQAAEAFDKLGSYSDASLNALYSKALAAGEAGEYDDAIASLTALGSFKDASLQVTYYSARQLESMGVSSAESAANLYESIALFRDSKARAAACRELLTNAEDVTTVTSTDSEHPMVLGHMFRSLPWGVSADMVQGLYTDLEKVDDPNPLTIAQITRKEPATDVNYNSINKFTNRGVMTQLSSDYPSDYGIRVGGLFTSTWSCYFANLPVNGRLTYDLEDTYLYAARYTFSTADNYYSKEDMGKLLTERLSLLYGEPTKASGNFTHWEGINDTEIILNLDPEYGRVYLSYVWNGGDELLKTADEATDPSSSLYKRLFMNCNGL